MLLVFICDDQSTKNLRFNEMNVAASITNRGLGRYFEGMRTLYSTSGPDSTMLQGHFFTNCP
jgi:hypothetical protein